MRETYYWVQIPVDAISDEQFEEYLTYSLPNRANDAKEMVENAISPESKLKAKLMIIDTVSPEI